MPRTDLQSLVAEQAPRYAEELLSPLIELLGQAREAFRGDVDKFLILLTVAIRAAGHKAFVQAAQAAQAAGAAQETTPPPGVFPTLGLNIQSVADSIGAPKETVRRKVAELVDAGWIDRRESQLHMTAEAYQALAGVRDLIAAQAARNYETVRQMLEGPDAA